MQCPGIIQVLWRVERVSAQIVGNLRRDRDSAIRPCLYWGRSKEGYVVEHVGWPALVVVVAEKIEAITAIKFIDRRDHDRRVALPLSAFGLPSSYVSTNFKITYLEFSSNLFYYYCGTAKEQLPKTHARKTKIRSLVRIYL